MLSQCALWQLQFYNRLSIQGIAIMCHNGTKEYLKKPTCCDQSPKLALQQTGLYRKQQGFHIHTLSTNKCICPVIYTVIIEKVRNTFKAPILALVITYRGPLGKFIIRAIISDTLKLMADSILMHQRCGVILQVWFHITLKSTAWSLNVFVHNNPVIFLETRVFNILSHLIVFIDECKL